MKAERIAKAGTLQLRDSETDEKKPYITEAASSKNSSHTKLASSSYEKERMTRTTLVPHYKAKTCPPICIAGCR
jgi:hypothetical protein